jgi:hypothetical protein
MSARHALRKRSISPSISESSRGARSVRWKPEPEQRIFDPDTVMPGWEGDDDDIDQGEGGLEVDEVEEEGMGAKEKEKRVS